MRKDTTRDASTAVDGSPDNIMTEAMTEAMIETMIENNNPTQKNNKSINRLFLYSMLFISVFSAFIIGFFWVREEFARFGLDAQKMRQDYVDNQKELVRGEVLQALDYVAFRRSRASAKGTPAPELQQEILEYLGKVTFGKNGYIFTLDYNGVTLWNEKYPHLVGQNVWAKLDKDGARVSREAREAAIRPDGGFISYMWFPKDSKEKSPKISYVKSVNDWQWIIGAGIYVYEIDRVIAAKRLELETTVKNRIIKAIGLFFLVLLAICLMTFFFSRKLRREFDVFIEFFKDAALSHEKIDRSKLFADEFKVLADSANRMLEERGTFENSLRESEERLAVTFRSIGEGVVTTDIQKRVTLINRVAEELIGRDRGTACGLPLDRVLDFKSDKSDGSENPVNKAVEKVLSRGELVEFSDALCLVSTNDTQRLISLAAAPVRDYESRIIGAVIVFQDVTEKQKMEEELQKKQKLESLGLLAGGIAHDFNNLLTGIMGNINLAKATVQEANRIDDPVYPILVTAEKATTRARQLTQQLLTFSRGGAPVKRVHHLSPIIEESLAICLRGANIKGEYKADPDLRPVEVDGGQISQVINNLVINAVQAMPGGGQLNIHATNVTSGGIPGKNPPGQDAVKIVIQDNGTGIPPEQIKKIFDPYFTTKADGSGLGLTSSYSIISKHGGDIEVESRPGEGTVFTIYLPACEGHPDCPPADETEEDDTEANVAIGAGKILVMDDDDMVMDIALRMLEHLGYQSAGAPDGAAALKIYKEAMEKGEPFSAVLMDLTIPGGEGGAEIIGKLIELDPNARAIVSSGYSNNPVMANFRTYGFKGCIIKPYKLQELGKVLHGVLK